VRVTNFRALLFDLRRAASAVRRIVMAR
jgi:hypothetical protein